MRKKVVSAILCASMVAGMVVIPGVAVKADDKKLIGVTMPTKDLQRDRKSTRLNSSHRL